MKPPAAAVAQAVHAAIAAVIADSGRTAGPIAPTSLLAADLGLDSLDLAQTVVLLERSLGVDPFRAAPAAASRPGLRTVSDLISLYANGPAAAPP